MPKNILITGGSRGIGKATAQLLKKSGYEVLAPGSQELDVTDQDSIDAYFKTKIKSKLHAVICNAGVFHSDSLENHSIEDWTRVIDTNLTGTFRVCKKALKHLSKNSHIIMISSVSAEGEAYASAYATSKAGINGLCKSLAYELGSEGINVNAIAPGWVRTDMAKSILSTKAQERDNLGATLQNRYIEPSEVAGLIEYLLSPQAKAITGQVLTIDAGL